MANTENVAVGTTTNSISLVINNDESLHRFCLEQLTGSEFGDPGNGDKISEYMAILHRENPEAFHGENPEDASIDWNAIADEMIESHKL